MAEDLEATQLNEPGGALWWLRRLERILRDGKRLRELQLYDDYYSGKHRLKLAGAKFADAFGGLFTEFADNWCDLVPDAVEERLTVTGFRMQPPTRSKYSERATGRGDEQAWKIWQANQLDADSQVAHVEALVKKASYVIVGPPDDKGIPSITVEDPSQVVIAYEPGSRRRRLAALKMWQEDDGRWMATVYLPDAIYKFQTHKSGERLVYPDGISGGRWYVRQPDDEDWPLANPTGVVDVVALTNRPRLLQDGESEIRKVIPVQDGINKLLMDMFVAAEFTAFPQRWATGIDIPIDPDTGKPIEAFKVAVDRLLIAKKENAKFGQFPAAKLEPYVEAIGMLVQHVASQTRTPPHYFYLRGEFPSGESIKAAETGLVAKARRKQIHFGEGWEEVIRIALLWLDKDVDELVGMETIWGDPESRSESEHVDAVMKMLALGLPKEFLWRKLGLTEQEILEAKALIAEEGLLMEDVGAMRTALDNAGRSAPEIAPPPDALAEDVDDDGE